MASKYAGVIDKLPRMLSTEPDYQGRVNLVKNVLAVDFPTAAAQTAEYVKLRAEEAELDEQLSAVHLRKNALEQLITDQFEAEGMSMMKLETGQSVSVQVEPYAQVTDREALRTWAISNGLERSLALPWQTVNALTKERLLAGDSEPDGAQAHARAKIVLRKG